MLKTYGNALLPTLRIKYVRACLVIISNYMIKSSSNTKLLHIYIGKPESTRLVLILMKANEQINLTRVKALTSHTENIIWLLRR